MSADAFSMFWLTVLFFIVVPGILYWICCDPHPRQPPFRRHASLEAELAPNPRPFPQPS